ncbi:hypothetical protein [Cryobacterium melibiosiphilum]|uniref:hypothetical protein n=1 Tax=Cryobacterium melibiosiphilum TaxID=995039 RepID=UPI0011C24235|nr:hypothetical protein [Cryobacterium melibiosiphilum]
MVTTVVFPWGILTKHVNKVLEKSQPFKAIPRGRFTTAGYRIVELSAVIPSADDDNVADMAEELDWLLNCKLAVDFLTAPHRIENA